MKFVKLLTFLLLLSQSFFIDAVEGNFQQIAGSPFETGANPASSAYSPIASGNLFVAIPNFGDDTVSVYEANQTTGVLTPVVGSPFSTGSEPAWQAFSPIASGNLFSAVANFSSNSVSVYEVAQATGTFIPVIGSPFATGVGPASVEFSPIVSGNLFAAIPNTSDDNVSVYLVNQMTGTFIPVPGSPFPTGSVPNFATFSPLVSGNLFAAVANFDSDTVSVYAVNQVTGLFTPVPGSPFPTGTTPYSVRFTPLVSGNLFAAVANNISDNISVYLVNQTTGVFTEVPGSPFPAGSAPNELAFSLLPSGMLLAAVVNFDSNDVSVYEVNQTMGTFIPVAGSPFATEEKPDGIAFSPLLSGNLFAAVGNFGDNTVSVFQVTTNSTPPTPPLPPTNLKGFQKANKFLNRTDYVNIITWDPPLIGTGIGGYLIFRNNQFLGEISSQQHLKFIDSNIKKGKTYTYYIISINSAGLSIPALVIVKGYKK